MEAGRRSNRGAEWLLLGGENENTKINDRKMSIKCSLKTVLISSSEATRGLNKLSLKTKSVIGEREWGSGSDD